MHSLVTSLEERLKQNAKLHSIKLLIRALKICLRGGDEGREWRGGEARRGEGLRRKEREGRECKRAEANEKQLTSFPCRGKNINTVIIIRCSNVHIIFTFASRWWVGWGGDLENEIGGEGREKYEERRECKYKFQINYIEQVNSINLRKA